jgi:hypothetical protein
VALDQKKPQSKIMVTRKRNFFKYVAMIKRSFFEKDLCRSVIYYVTFDKIQ